MPRKASDPFRPGEGFPLVVFERQDDRFLVRAEYRHGVPDRCRALGGDWDGRLAAWVFPEDRLDEVEILYRDCYGKPSTLFENEGLSVWAYVPPGPEEVGRRARIDALRNQQKVLRTRERRSLDEVRWRKAAVEEHKQRLQQTQDQIEEVENELRLLGEKP